MELKKVKELVEYFEDRIIKNFETHFSYLVLEDFYSGGYDDRIEDEFYYDEYYSKYESDITNLLLEIEDDMSSEFMNLKLRLIKLKRIIDTRLSKIESNINPPLRSKKRNVQFILSSKIDKQEFIKTLHNQLIEYKLIDTDFNNFEKHFDKDWEDKIQWKGTELQIANLITKLIDNTFLDIETQNFKNKLITAHFINKKGNNYKEKQLSSVLAEKKDYIPDDDVTIKIIQELSTNL
ncbi:hypothetical protein [Olleya sp. Hel_I_94]|uniref:hypothetical protein n=1 Tax=Olleya sp. Hel_I_94 TaxID=1250001 RepID=UPI0011A87419|nr:hypothetical protein [Olleya sp. Hel_I_94]TVZ48654.1 hypothetical protein JM82_3304 [Olleya sp. Hel_I_94]